MPRTHGYHVLEVTTMLLVLILKTRKHWGLHFILYGVATHWEAILSRFEPLLLHGSAKANLSIQSPMHAHPGLRATKPGGFPLFSGKVQIVSLTLSGLFLVVLIGWERGKGPIGRIPGESPDKSGKSQKNRGKSHKGPKKDKKGQKIPQKGRTSSRLGNPPGLNPPPFSGPWLKVSHTRRVARSHPFLVFLFHLPHWNFTAIPKVTRRTIHRDTSSNNKNNSRRHLNHAPEEPHGKRKPTIMQTRLWTSPTRDSFLQVLCGNDHARPNSLVHILKLVMFWHGGMVKGYWSSAISSYGLSSLTNSLYFLSTQMCLQVTLPVEPATQPFCPWAEAIPNTLCISFCLSLSCWSPINTQSCLGPHLRRPVFRKHTNYSAQKRFL